MPHQLPVDAADERVLRAGHGGPRPGVQRLQPRHGHGAPSRRGRAGNRAGRAAPGPLRGAEQRSGQPRPSLTRGPPSAAAGRAASPRAGSCGRSGGEFPADGVNASSRSGKDGPRSGSPAAPVRGRLPSGSPGVGVCPTPCPGCSSAAGRKALDLGQGLRALP